MEIIFLVAVIFSVFFIFGFMVFLRKKHEAEEMLQGMGKEAPHSLVEINRILDIHTQHPLNFAESERLHEEGNKRQKEYQIAENQANLIRNELSELWELHHSGQIDSEKFCQSEKELVAKHDEALRIRDEKYAAYSATSKQHLAHTAEQIAQLKKRQAARKTLTPEADTTALANFSVSDSFIGHCSMKRGIAIDRVNKQIGLVNIDRKEVVPYNKIISSEICIDSETVISTDRVGQIGGALLGGALTGGFGAVVMAMGAKKKQLENVKKVELKILTAGSTTPIFIIQFFPGIWVSSRSAIEEATKWHDLLSVAIKESQMASGALPTSSHPAPTSVADEIKKLADLKAQGLLTEAEFDKAKSTLLAT